MPTISINRQWRLTPDQYFETETEKTQIVLHHTVGGSARSTFEYWQSNPDRIATSYLIDRDGTIYEVFDPLYWAHHLGLKVPKNVVYNKASIGIEVCSEGALRTGKELNDRLPKQIVAALKDPTSKLFDEQWLYAYDIDVLPFTNAKKLHPLVDTSKYYQHIVNWRDYMFWDSYENVQVDAVYSLVKHLCEQFDIPKIVAGTPEFDQKFYELKGIITHTNVRTDKTDLHPGWSWDQLKTAIG